MPSDPQASLPEIVRLPLAAAGLALLLLGGCAQPPSGLDQILARGQLRVVTLNSPTTYYLGAHGPQGLEYRLAEAFAHELGVQLVMQPVSDVAAMRQALAAGHADIAAAQITAAADWRQMGLIAATYEDIPQLVIQGRGKPHPRDITSLRKARVAVRAGSPQVQLLREIRGNGVPYLSWTELARDQAEPLDEVSGGGADYAIVDANEFAFARHLYPEASIAFTLPDPRPVQWVVQRGAADLRNAVDRFFSAARVSGLLADIEAEATAESHGFDYQEAHQFQADIAAKLPDLQSLFVSAANATGIDWRLLAAVGYQESKWEMSAQSANGALGIMMLTPDAATTVGVTDRRDPQQSILGGARYLAQVLDTIPNRIVEPDRTWLALAAYNVGYGHLEDARVLTQMRGKNPDSWTDVSQQLPLLTQEQWFTRVKRGYARGWEPANFVAQVRQYLAVLEWLDASPAANSSTGSPINSPKTPAVDPAVQAPQIRAPQKIAAR